MIVDVAESCSRGGLGTRCLKSAPPSVVRPVPVPFRCWHEGERAAIARMMRARISCYRASAPLADSAFFDGSDSLHLSLTVVKTAAGLSWYSMTFLSALR